LAAALCLGAPAALAQGDTERAGARAAATEGGKAFDEGRYKEAIDLFTRAESLVHAPPHLLFIARSHEKLGQLVKAREAYLKITREKLAADAPDPFKEAQAAATQELSALEPRVPYLTITVKGDGADGATVSMDDQPVPKALVGVPYPVDPGEHKLQATGTGVQSPVQTITVKEGAKESIELALAPAEGAGAGPGEGASGSGEVSLGDAGPTSGGTNGMRIGAYVALGVGVVGLAGGTFFLLQASSKESEADDLCTLPGGGCPADKADEIKALDDDASSARTLATVGFIVGGVGIATGVTLFILSSNKSSASNKPGIEPWVGLGSAGVSGRF
jgi:hypothetical protein